MICVDNYNKGTKREKMKMNDLLGLMENLLGDIDDLSDQIISADANEQISIATDINRAVNDIRTVVRTINLIQRQIDLDI